MAWTDERIEQLRQMWQAGMTASQIAEALGGVSRNAVIGKAHRLGLQARPSPVKPGETAAAESDEPAIETPSAPVAAEAAPVAPTPVAPAPSPAPAPVAARPAEPASPPAPPVPDAPAVRSIGPGGFQRQNPHEQQPPIPPAPPRRLVPAKPSSDIAGKTSLLDLNDRICKWPLGHPGEPDFHFCGNPINQGFPYCLQHCSVAYQAQLPRRDRRPPPPLPYGAPRVR
ncbi:GcrA family cell cycle regulator [Sphingomonas nostoxanthinifaciens]|uniref:GcrA family cell cycle regulator n=1 Tax=Sphingomonas nostoxanthinifaciens TaxID=2872652 RepID=UPI001CC1EA6C|nr:GcrA family cell cycle regulator [Sphingomonas nostoxanthinifaciens]UAK23479.1 GcrA family cell cycle regulator [Sphingomonas nostoxanthinifaciens]